MRRKHQPETEPTIEPRSYYALTQSQDEVDEGLRLDSELDDAKDAIAALEAQRETVADSLRSLAEQAEFRRQRREELAAQRDEAATRADLDAVAEASRLIDATERIDAAQEVIAGRRRDALANLDATVEAAQEAVAEAEAKVAEHKHATAGRYPKFVVDHFVATTARALIAKFEAAEDEGDSVSLAEAVADLPDVVAEAVAKDPLNYFAIWRADHAPAVPEPKKRLSFEEAKQMLEDARAALREYAAEEARRQQAARDQGPYTGSLGWGEIEPQEVQ